jgi:hypothetical protein
MGSGRGRVLFQPRPSSFLLELKVGPTRPAGTATPMRWKLLRRRLSVSAPRMIVRSHLPWPLRWALAAVMLGFSAAIALWAFEFGRTIAGLDRGAQAELQQLRLDVQRLRADADEARRVSSTAESLLAAERATQVRLTQQVRQLDADRQALRADLGFFERLMPAEGDGLQMRGLRADSPMPGQLRYQMLVMQNTKTVVEFNGRYEVLLTGLLDGKPWSQPLPGGAQPLQLRQYVRVEGVIEYPPTLVLQGLQARVVDARGNTRAAQSLKL